MKIYRAGQTTSASFCRQGQFKQWIFSKSCFWNWNQISWVRSMHLHPLLVLIWCIWMGSSAGVLFDLSFWFGQWISRTTAFLCSSKHLHLQDPLNSSPSKLSLIVKVSKVWVQLFISVSKPKHYLRVIHSCTLLPATSPVFTKYECEGLH
jgi:hypothetical protein